MRGYLILVAIAVPIWIVLIVAVVVVGPALPAGAQQAGGLLATAVSIALFFSKRFPGAAVAANTAQPLYPTGAWQPSGYAPAMPAMPAAMPGVGTYAPPSVPLAPGVLAPQVERGTGAALAGLILGILSIPAAAGFAIIGLVLGIIGIIVSAIGRRSFTRRLVASVGLRLSVIAVFLALSNSLLGVLLVLSSR